MKTRLILMSLVLGVCALLGFTTHAQSKSQSPTAKGTSSTPDDLQKNFGEYLASHDQTPEDYVVGKFRDHDIVFVGEQHHIQQNLDFAQRLIPKLYAAGIYNMGWEFANSEDQPAIDRLLNAPTWDEKAAEQILWKCYNLMWVSTGYVGTLHAAWQLNHSLRPEARRFRIVGVNIQSRLVSRSQLLPGETVPTDKKVRARVMGLNDFDVVNIHWAQVISEEFIAKHEKALIYCGSGHTWTRFFFQRAIDNALTVGNLLYDYIGERVVRLVLNGELQGGEEFDPTVESLLKGLGDEHHPAGFDVRGSPLGNIPVHIPGYLYRSKPDHQLTAGDIWDGYIYVGPYSEWRSDKFIASFITPENFPRLLESWDLFEPGAIKMQITSPDQLSEIVRKEVEHRNDAPASLK